MVTEVLCDCFFVSLLKFCHLKGSLAGEITEIATGEKSSPFMRILWGWFCLPIAICAFPYLIFSGRDQPVFFCNAGIVFAPVWSQPSLL